MSLWTKTEDLSVSLSISLDQTIIKFPTQGWIRCNSEKCDARLQFVDMNSAISQIQINRINTVHIMASGTSSYISVVKTLLKNIDKRNTVHIFVHFRLGSNSERITLLESQYNIWWNDLRKDHPKIQFHFSCEKDFMSSFRGIVINQQIGLVGFYVRTNNGTIGTMENCMFVDKTTDVGRYIIEYFLKCFQGQHEYQTLKACIDHTN